MDSEKLSTNEALFNSFNTFSVDKNSSTLSNDGCEAHANLKILPWKNNTSHLVPFYCSFFDLVVYILHYKIDKTDKIYKELACKLYINIFKRLA